MARLAVEARHLLASQTDLAAALDQLNIGWDEGFVTMTVAVLDEANHEIRLVNAGNLSPFVRKADGSVEQIGAEHTGLPVGVSPDFKYESFTYSLEPGDAVVMLTDGLSEAMNGEGQLYGSERLRAQLLQYVAEVKELGAGLLANVQEFAGDRPQADDMCLVCFQRTGECSPRR
jgi:sigma-B regulation protein RsbU (phosphoserine phosphatase)